MPKFIEIHTEQLAQLDTLLEMRLPQSGMILNAVRFVSRGMFPEETLQIKFYALENIIDNTDEAFIVAEVLLRKTPKAFMLSSTPKLISTEDFSAFENLIDWQNIVLFANLSDHFATIVENMSVKHGNIKVERIPCYQFTISIEQALKLSLNSNLLQSVEVKELSAEDAVQVHRNWKGSEADPETLGYLEDGIKTVGSIGVYLKSNAKLVSGVVALWVGSLNALFTEKDSQRKGYAEVTVKSAAKMIAQKGLIPVANVECDNIPSKTLMEKCGLHSCQTIYWVVCTPSQD